MASLSARLAAFASSGAWAAFPAGIWAAPSPAISPSPPASAAIRTAHEARTAVAICRPHG
eukprot:scaffold7308_cov114-Isochrysis_galbana.AAC.3